MSRRLRASRATTYLLPLTLMACANGNCDPTQAGFFSGISGEVSGCYAARDRVLQNNLSAARTDLDQQMFRARATATDRAAAENEREFNRGRLRAMGNENAILRRRFESAPQQESAARAAVSRRLSELDELERDRRAALTQTPDPAAVQALDRRRRALLDSATSF